jgi:flagellar biosynthetic protein FlhB
MAEDYQGQEKTEEPTPRKSEKAREEGQVVRSRELTTLVVVLGGALGLIFFGGGMVREIVSITHHAFEASIATDMRDVMTTATTGALLATLPLLLVTVVLAIVSSGALGGFLVAPKALAFKVSRLSPIAGFRRMFSVRSLVELVKALAKFLVVAGVAVVVLHTMSDDLLSLGLAAPGAGMREGMQMMLHAFVALAASLILIAGIDVPFQLAQHKKQLRMTRQEVRDELKDSEGRPEVRSRIRRTQQEIARRRMLADVPTADVVITNPEHYSVALKYDPATMAAPRVVAKGADLIAFRIREIAAANDVPVVRTPALARAIYWVTDIGRDIPSALYVAVARVLAYVYQLKLHKSGMGPEPRALADPEVPPEYRRD